MEDLKKQITVSVFTRHSFGCKHKADRFTRRCTCPKWFYISGDGLDRRVSAKTRDGRTADLRAEAEERRLRGVPDQSTPLANSSTITVEEALDAWIKSIKQPWKPATTKKYGSIKRKILAWAKDNNIQLLIEVNAVRLDAWRGEWGLEAEIIYNRMDRTSQNQFQARLKAFFKWAYNLEYFQRDPAATLGKIRFDPKKTQPLTPEQFDQLIAATDEYDTFRRVLPSHERFGAELKSIFQIQRWTGLRILDVLVLPRKAIFRGVLKTKTLKTGALVEAELPKIAIAALADVKPRLQTHKDYFFWNHNCTTESLRTKWENRIRILRKQLSFLTEEGEPMRFHSHMLRDTYAVEMLLLGVPMEEVSRMLTHKNIGTTQKHYDPWVKRRRDQLETIRVAALKKMGATFGA